MFGLVIFLCNKQQKDIEKIQEGGGELSEEVLI